MPEKSARPAASLRICFLGYENLTEPSNGADCAIQFDLVSILEPVEQSGDRNHSRNPKLTRHNRRVREQAAALDQQAASGGKQHDPPGIGMVGHQDAAGGQLRMLRIAHHASLPTHNAGTAAQTLPLVAA